MRCPDCQIENPEGRKFCRECGASLVGACPTCGHANDPGDKFCGECGNRLAPGSPAPASGPARAAGPGAEAERRHLTVMFCDLVGSTAMSARLDPEDLREINRAYQDAGARAIEKFDGYVARYMGDGILAYFGYPRAHEDDAERAVRAGLALVEGAAELSRTLGHGRGVELRVRVGIATGLVVVGDLVGEDAAQERAVIGETPNLAARLQGVAAPDTVVVSDSTRTVLGGRFDLRDLGVQQLKGFAEPTGAWEVSGEAARTTRLESTGSAPFIGRAAELVLLADRWSRAERGEGQVVYVSGEAGIGKSRLLHALVERVGGSASAWLHLRCSPYHTSSALHPVLEEIAVRAGFEPKDPPDVRLRRLVEVFDHDPDAAAVGVPLLASMLSIPLGDEFERVELQGDARKQRLLEFMVQHVVWLAAAGPVLITVEDLHWVDPTTLELLERLVECCADRAILMVATARPDREPGWARGRGVAVINLGKLGKEEAAAMAEGVTGGVHLPADVMLAIIERTGGVPLFVEETTKAVLASGALREADGRLDHVDSTAVVTIPASLQESLLARLDRLGDAKRTAQVGAAIGREFSRGLLARVMDVPDGLLDDTLATLVASQLLTRRVEHGVQMFVFRHALLQDAAYESLLLSRRKQLHAAIAAAVIELEPQLVAREPERVAHHLSRAGRPDDAVEYWKRAGERAAERSANVEAVRHFGDALACLAHVTESEVRVDRELQLLIDLVASCRLVDFHVQALEALDRAERLATAHGRIERLAELNYYRGNLYFTLGNNEGCEQAHRAGLQFARQASSAEAEARALGGLGDAAYIHGKMNVAHQRFQECVALAREHGFKHIETANRSMIGWTGLWLLKIEEALAHGLAGIDLAVEIGHRRAEMISASLVGFTLVEMRRFAEGEAYTNRSTDIARRLGTRSFEASAHYYRARLALFSGDRATARESLSTGLELLEGAGMAFVGAALIGLTAMAAETDEERIAALERATAILDQGAVGHGYLWLCYDGIDACVLAGDWGWAGRLIEMLEDFDQHDPLPATAFHVERGKALIRAGRDGLDAQTRAALERLRAQAVEVRLMRAVPLIDAALSR